MSLVRFRHGRLFPRVALLTLAAVAGCVSSTILDTQPTGARVFLNGVAMGTTPYTMIDSNIVTTLTSLRFEYPGYSPLNVTVARDEEIDPVPLVAGVIIWPLLLWCLKYHPTHMFVLMPGAGVPPAPYAVPAPPPAEAAPPATGPAGYPAPPPGYPPPAPDAPPPGYPPPQ
ncbi:MAG TPA: PEGA domain-containing protein [Polyangia bacterium]|nr:PEGA domain-containing protein [Polyangia bacterium]